VPALALLALLAAVRAFSARIPRTRGAATSAR
jgi:hypothetical protein